MTEPAAAATSVIRIDAGSSSSYTDAAGRVWEADRAFVSGATTANASRTGPSLTSDPMLLKTMRYGKDFSYSVPVPSSGTYLVRLLTSELNFSAAGSRKFTVTAEGRRVAADLDLAKAPGLRNPWTLEVPVAVSDGRLDLRFVAALDYAQVSAIEVVRADSWVLAWADEFSGTSVDTAKWNVRNDTWASNEESIVTSRPDNVFVSNGTLTIRSLRETRTVGGTTRSYTSGYLDTKGKHAWTYGRFAVRARLATQAGTSKGIWPAFWLRPEDGGIGEIDVLEALGSAAGESEWNKAHQAIHYDYVGTHPHQPNTYVFPEGVQPSDGFHTYTVDWEPGRLTWYVDDRKVWERNRTTTAWIDQAFSRPFNLRLNQQVGGSWAGSPNLDTVFPADYVVDWVRVYQRR